MVQVGESSKYRKHMEVDNWNILECNLTSRNCVNGMPHESCLLRTSCTLSARCFLLHAASGSGGVLLVRFSGTPGKLLCVKPQRLEARGELSPDKVPHVFLGLFVESLRSSQMQDLKSISIMCTQYIQL